MIRRKYNHRSNFNRREYVKANQQIRFPEVRVLNDQGEMLGLMSSLEALQKAQAAGKDLVLVTEQSKPPVVKIIDLAKFRYQLQQKAAKSRKSAKTQDLKELRFSPFMGESDFQSRLKKAIVFLERGDKVRLSLQFKGRVITKKEFGFGLFDRIITETANLAKVEITPKMMGNKLIAQLIPSKK